MTKFLSSLLTLIICISIQAQRIEHFSYSQCGGNKDSLSVSSVPEGAERIYDRIISQEYANNILKLRFGKLSNCAGISNPNSFFSRDTLKIIFDDFVTRIDTMEDGSIVESHDIVMCDCYFESDYVISDLPKEPLTILVNGTEIQNHPKYKTYPVTFEVLDGDTINYIDKYGLEQGKWIVDIPNGGYIRGFQKDGKYITRDYKSYYDNNQLKGEYVLDSIGRGFGRQFYSNGNLMSVHTKTGVDKEVLIYYYENGNVKRHYINTDMSRDVTLEFYENGNLEKTSMFRAWNEYYANGQLKIKRLYSNNPKNIWAMYFYDTGETMAIYYIETDNFSVKRRWWECFDKSGKSVSKEYLVKQGYDFIRD
jgi:antitoxin component YwqK of YwqJK toxin-antitoxin module